jgi:hypothetical protein
MTNNAKAALLNAPLEPRRPPRWFYPRSLHDDRVKNVTEESVRKAAFARGSCGKEPWFKRE